MIEESIKQKVLKACRTSINNTIVMLGENHCDDSMYPANDDRLNLLEVHIRQTDILLNGKVKKIKKEDHFMAVLGLTDLAIKSFNSLIEDKTISFDNEIMDIFSHHLQSVRFYLNYRGYNTSVLLHGETQEDWIYNIE